MRLPKKITTSEKYEPAMALTEQAEADEYFEVLVQHSMMNFGKTRQEAEELEKTNLGYFAGYSGAETRERVERLFSCAHPIFGAIAEKDPPTVEEILAMGNRSAMQGEQ